MTTYLCIQKKQNINNVSNTTITNIFISNKHNTPCDADKLPLVDLILLLPQFTCFINIGTICFLKQSSWCECFMWYYKWIQSNWFWFFWWCWTCYNHILAHNICHICHKMSNGRTKCSWELLELLLLSKRECNRIVEYQIISDIWYRVCFLGARDFNIFEKFLHQPSSLPRAFNWPKFQHHWSKWTSSWKFAEFVQKCETTIFKYFLHRGLCFQ